MQDGSGGVYISYRTFDGTLVSSSRDTVEEVLADIPGLHKILAEFNTGNVFTMPTTGLAMSDAIANVEAAFSDEPTTSSQSPVATSQFESCNICGGPKNVWKPPGVSRNSGKPYPGFFSCQVWHK